MITIHNLEIRFDVEGNDDERSFAKLFNEFIRKWSAQNEKRRETEIAAERERSLTGPADGAMSW